MRMRAYAVCQSKERSPVCAARGHDHDRTLRLDPRHRDRAARPIPPPKHTIREMPGWPTRINAAYPIEDYGYLYSFTAHYWKLLMSRGLG